MRKNFLKKIVVGACVTLTSMCLYTGDASASIYDIHGNRVANEMASHKNNNTPVKVSTVPADHAYIPKGTVVTLELKNELTHYLTEKEDSVLLILRDAIVINDVPVVPSGTHVDGHVVGCDFKRVDDGKTINVAFTIDSMKTVNNVVVPLKYVNDGDLYDDNENAGLVVGKFTKKGHMLYPSHSYYQAEVVADTDLGVKWSELEEKLGENVNHGIKITLKQ